VARCASVAYAYQAKGCVSRGCILTNTTKAILVIAAAGGAYLIFKKKPATAAGGSMPGSTVSTPSQPVAGGNTIDTATGKAQEEYWLSGNQGPVSLTAPTNQAQQEYWDAGNEGPVPPRDPYAAFGTV
jgi:hypothetical protein